MGCSKHSWVKEIITMENQRDIRVLVVEKDQTVVESIERVLKEKSYIVTRSSNEDEALGLLRKTLLPPCYCGRCQRA